MATRCSLISLTTSSSYVAGYFDGSAPTLSVNTAEFSQPFLAHTNFAFDLAGIVTVPLFISVPFFFYGLEPSSVM